MDALSLARVVQQALSEDLGAGDVTTLWTVPAERHARAVVRAKAGGTLAGTEVARAVFQALNADLQVEPTAADGDPVVAGAAVLRVEGSARSILSGERVALNFLQRLSGIATLTRAFVDQVVGTGVRILDTRKTTPGLRALERAAVRAGGGWNHRPGLDAMVLIKENHLLAAGGISAAVEAVRRRNAARLRVEVEVTSLDETREAAGAAVDRILFDNMALAELRAAVDLARALSPGIETEASGGISLATVRAVAESGVDFVSVGALTHSAPALDLSLLVEP